MSLRPIVLIDNFDSFTYNLFQMVQAQSEAPVQVFRNNAIGVDGIRALNPSRIILSPGPGHPAIDSDFGVCRGILTEYETLSEFPIPLLGVCLGHQGLVHSFGGNIIGAPEIQHGKTSLMKVEDGIDSPLFRHLSNPFQAMRYHSLVAEEESFPHKHLKITARDDRHGLIMAVEHHRLPMYGVQFHPESIGTPEGGRMLKNFIDYCQTPIPEEV